MLGNGGHIISVSPRLETAIQGAAPYTLSKQLQTRLAVGLAEELRGKSVAVNCLWPDGQRSTEGTMLMRGGYVPGMLDPQVFADAALAIVKRDPNSYTGRTLLDTEVLYEEGLVDLSRYEPSETIKGIKFG